MKGLLMPRKTASRHATRRKRLLVVPVSILLTFMLLAAACGNDSATTTEEPAEEPAAAPAEEPAAAPAEEPAAAPAEEPAEEPAAAPAEEPAEEPAAAPAEATDPEACQPAPTKSALRLGNIGIYTGPPLSASFRSVKVAIEAWGEWVNCHGGINGHPVELIIKDNQGDASRSVTFAKELVEEDQVHAMIAGADTAGAPTNAPYFEEQGVPVIGGVALSGPWLSSPMYFPATSTLLGISFGYPNALAELGGSKNFGVIFCAEVAACAQIVGLLKPYVAEVGMEFTFETSVSGSDPDYTAACIAAEQAGVDGVYLALSAVTSVRVIEDCSEAGFNPNWTYGSSALTPQLARETTSLHGTLTTSPGYPYFLRDAQTEEFWSAIDRFASDFPRDELSFAIMDGWAAGKLFEAAAANIGDEPTREDILNGLFALTNEDLGGLVPSPLNYAPGEPNSLPACTFLIGVDEDGNLIAPSGGTPVCSALG